MVMMAGGQDRDAKLMVSHRGKIQRPSQGGRPKYTGGVNKLIKVSRSISLREFHDRLAVIAGCHKVAIRYVCPHDKQHAIRDVVTAEDLRRLLNSVLLRDLLIEVKKEFVPHVRAFVDRVDDVRPPLPESLFSSAPTTKTPPVVPPSCLNKRNASAPSLSANSADDPSNPPSPSLLQRSASASTLTQASPEGHTMTTTQGCIVHYAAPPYSALHRGPVGPAPLFLMPVGPAMIFQQVMPVYQGLPVPAGCPGGHLE